MAGEKNESQIPPEMDGPQREQASEGSPTAEIDLGDIDKVVCSCADRSVHWGRWQDEKKVGGVENTKGEDGLLLKLEKRVTSTRWPMQTDNSPPLKEASLLPYPVDCPFRRQIPAHPLQPEPGSSPRVRMCTASSTLEPRSRRNFLASPLLSR
jgi:hypothetical protein